MTGRVSNAPDGAGVSTSISGNPADEGQAFERLSTEAAKRGVRLHALADGSYQICRWGMTRAVPDQCLVVSLLRQMGVES